MPETCRVELPPKVLKDLMSVQVALPREGGGFFFEREGKKATLDGLILFVTENQIQMLASDRVRIACASWRSLNIGTCQILIPRSLIKTLQDAAKAEQDILTLSVQKQTGGIRLEVLSSDGVTLANLGVEDAQGYEFLLDILNAGEPQPVTSFEAPQFLFADVLRLCPSLKKGRPIDFEVVSGDRTRAWGRSETTTVRWEYICRKPRVASEPA